MTDERRPQGRRAAHEVGGQHDTITVPNPSDRITRRRELLLLELRAAHRRDDPIAVQVLQAKLAHAAGLHRRETANADIEVTLPTGDSPTNTVDSAPTNTVDSAPARRRSGRRRHGNRAGRR